MRQVGLVISAALLTASRCNGFSVTIEKPLAKNRHRYPSVWAVSSTSSEQPSEALSQEELFRNAEFVDIKVTTHKPLGCTVEETLGSGDHVFVSKLVPDGNAAKAGLQVGDVIVGVTGLFGELEDVNNAGIDKIKGLVASTPREKPLEFKIARGTLVMEEHEQAVVALCANEGFAGDKQIEECVVAYLSDGYAYDDNDDRAEQENQNEDDSEDMVGSLFTMWADDLPMPKISESPEDDGASNGKKAPAAAPKPWSSRSSPSGTFVRDPRSGRMTNIDR